MSKWIRSIRGFPSKLETSSALGPVPWIWADQNYSSGRLPALVLVMCSAPLKVGQVPVMFRRLVCGVGCIG